MVEEFRRKTNADLDDAFLDEFEANLQISQTKTRYWSRFRKHTNIKVAVAMIRHTQLWTCF